MSKGKPYNSVKRNLNNKTKSNNKNKQVNTKDNFDVTTRLRVDDVRLNDAESLDTSFLEGRFEKKVTKNGNKAKEKILKDKSKRRRKIHSIKRFCYFISLLFLIILLIVLFVNNKNYIFNYLGFNDTKKSKKDVVEETEKIIDDNYLFVGDFYTEKFNFDDYDLDYHYVKSSSSDLDTDDLLDNMKRKIYDYNPSIVFIQIGFNDLDDDKSVDDLINDIEKIINLIKENRPYATIYIESLYPINTDIEDFSDELVDNIDNDKINEFNEKISKIVSKNKVNYLDVYKVLEKDGKLDLNLTDDGVNLNSDGYNQVYKLISSVINKKN